MANSKIQVTPRTQAKQPRVKGDWYSAGRQAERDILRMGWARHVLEEENTHPLTHSAARIRRAQNIVASIQSKPS